MLPRMSFVALLMIVVAGALHAGWNALTKRSSDQLAFCWGLTGAIALLCAPLVAITIWIDGVDAVGRAIARGERVFWVCPKVDVDDDDSTAVGRHAMLSKQLNVPVGLVHGRLKPAEKDAALEDFRTGATRVLVATTVIEVGVDVPEATIMVIERAEGFGLAQLHQLRGRVGRGDKPSYCLLLFRPPLGDMARERIETLRRTDDGFEIAEADFRLRRPGDILGLRQAGATDYRVINLAEDAPLLAIASKDAEALVNEDPELESVRGKALRLVRELMVPRVLS